MATKRARYQGLFTTSRPARLGDFRVAVSAVASLDLDPGTRAEMLSTATDESVRASAELATLGALATCLLTPAPATDTDLVAALDDATALPHGGARGHGYGARRCARWSRRRQPSWRWRRCSVRGCGETCRRDGRHGEAARTSLQAVAADADADADADTEVLPPVADTLVPGGDRGTGREPAATGLTSRSPQPMG